MTIMIETRNLKKSFGPIEAVQGVSFRVEKGEVLGFLGPNGAGKSTVMRMLTCFLPPTDGTAAIGGHDIQTDSMEARKLIGYLPESNPLYVDMTTEAFLRFIAEMRGLKGAKAKEAIDRVIDSCWLTKVRYQVIETLSKGFQRRVGLAQALLHDPPVLVLDEPTDGLDPNQKREVHTLIRRMAAEKAIIISTHILDEVDSVCTRAIIIAEGRIAADGTPEELKRKSRFYGCVDVAIATDDKVDMEAISALVGVKSVEAIESEDGLKRFRVFSKNGKAVAHDLAQLAVGRGWRVEEMNTNTGDLTEVFRTITTKEGAHA